MIRTTAQEHVDSAITSRRSIRAFLPTPIDRSDIEQILTVASRAPSGSNIQPWKVHVLTGATKARLSAQILKAYSDPVLVREHTPEYQYYPREWLSPYIERRRATGWGLYSLLKITRENKEGMHAQHGRNYVFFDAPVGLVFSIDRKMEQGSWLDYGMFLQNIMIAARSRGLDTCPQVAFIQFHKIIKEELQLPDSAQVVCAMSLGYADTSAVENRLITDRGPLSQFVTFMD
jgi:nitroreductase